jgi:GTP cyclohydrolase I
MERIWHAQAILEDVTGLAEDMHGRDTPKRFLEMLRELTQCKDTSDAHLKECIKWKDFPAEDDEMIIVRDLPFVSICNHHVIPFIGKAHIGYIPKTTNAGLSKFGRVVRHYSRQLQVQERMTKQVHDFLEVQLDPRGLAVVVEAEHLCMAIRGVQMPGARTRTQKMSGVFADHSRTAKMEFFASINGGH